MLCFGTKDLAESLHTGCGTMPSKSTASLKLAHGILHGLQYCDKHVTHRCVSVVAGIAID
jgi:hypothetical protein